MILQINFGTIDLRTASLGSLPSKSLNCVDFNSIEMNVNNDD